MLNMAKGIVVGRVGARPEVRVFENGDRIVKFSVAVNSRTTNPATGETVESTEWYAIETRINKHIDYAASYLDKGSLVYCEGKIKSRGWLDKEGKVRAESVIVIGAKGELGGLESGGKIEAAIVAAEAGAAPSGVVEKEATDDDDVPF